MVATSLLIALAASASPSVAAPAFNVVNVPPNVAQFCSEQLATELGDRGLRVITAAQINALLGMERQKQLLGCDEAQATSCMAELAAALGTEGVLIGNLAKLGQSYQLNFKIIRSDNGELLSTHRSTATTEEQLVPELSRAAATLARETLAKLRGGAVPPTAVEADPPAVSAPAGRSWPLWPTLAAGGFGVASGVTFGMALSRRDQVAKAAVADYGDAVAKVDEGKTLQTVALVTGGLAVAALGTAVVMYLLSGEREPEAVSLGLSPGGIALTGSFP